jgi:GTP-binding protein EngB required for normal cell division/tetratricopeptide (TPR) repeat protein
MGLVERMVSSVSGELLEPEARDELAQAVAMAEGGDLDVAEVRLAAAAARWPRALPLQVALGQVKAERRDDEGAVAAFGRAVDLSVDASWAWLGLGDALVRLGRADPARDAYRRVLSSVRDPERRSRAHAGRGRLALTEGRTAKAVRELRKAAELAPLDMTIAADLGRALMAARDYQGWQWLLRAAQEVMTTGVDVGLVIEAARASPKREPALSLLRAALAAGLSQVDRARVSAELARQLAVAPPGVEPDLIEARTRVAEALQAAGEDGGVLEAARVVAEAAADPAEALRVAGRAAELGLETPAEVMVRLALAAEDRSALAAVAARLAPDDALGGAVRAFLDGNASEDELVRLGAVGRSEGARRFVVAALAPPEPPRGNLFALLGYARDLSARTPEWAPLVQSTAHAAEAFDRPLLIAVMGEFNAGKSSFVNALCGAEVAPVGVTPTTATINVVRFGPPGGRVLYHDGRAEDLPAEGVAAFLNGLDAEQAAAVRMVEIFFPLDVLRRVEIVDTPGLNSLRPEHERVARAFFTEADAIVWLFAVGQAAKASEREALSLARGAGKRVLGVLNKADQASPEEREEVVRHVRGGVGQWIEDLVPLSARNALRAEARGDQAALEASGLPALMAALDQRFFSDSRALKRRTALAALARFASEARRLLGEELPDDGALERRREGLEATHASVDGALAAERVALRARLEAAFRQAAREVLEFVRPRRWPFGERRAEAADEEFLFDLLDDAVAQGTEVTRRHLEEAASAGPPLPIAAALDRFRAYARGVLAGGLVRTFLHDELTSAGPRAERATLERSLARRVPDVEGELVAPLAADIDAAYAKARTVLDEEVLRAGMRRLVRGSRAQGPLAALVDAVGELEGTAGEGAGPPVGAGSQNGGGP